MKRINVITVNLNNADGLLKTMKSVFRQTRFDLIDYIIIDGGSTDGSRELISDYELFFERIVSEKDKGIYNAMNKGIDLADDDYTIFLNSGDHFHCEDVVERMYAHLDKDIVYGDLCIHHIENPDETFIKEYASEIPADYFTYEALPHEAAFVRTDLLKRKRFREDYKIISDTIFFHEAIMDGQATYKHVDLVVTDFYLGGISSNVPKMLKEKERYFIEYNNI